MFTDNSDWLRVIPRSLWHDKALTEGSTVELRAPRGMWMIEHLLLEAGAEQAVKASGSRPVAKGYVSSDVCQQTGAIICTC